MAHLNAVDVETLQFWELRSAPQLGDSLQSLSAGLQFSASNLQPSFEDGEGPHTEALPKKQGLRHRTTAGGCRIR